MKPVKKLMATVGTYVNANGESKSRYHQVGIIFEDQNGKQSIKIESMPVGNTFNGWLNVFDFNYVEKQQTNYKKLKEESQDFDRSSDDIPF